MALIKDGALADDPFRPLGDDETPTTSADVSVTLEQWRENREALTAIDGSLALRLPNDAEVEDIADDLSAFAAVIVEFPTFSDGRGFSQARQLREQCGFEGEIRATGHIIRDQYLFLHRCGVNAIEVADAKALDAWNAAMQEFSLFYQRTADRRTTVPHLRGAAPKARPDVH